MINVTLKTPNGQTLEGVLPDNFNRNDFRNLIERLLGGQAPTTWVFICKGKQLNVDNEIAFNKWKQLVTNGCVIRTTQR